ncbi:hypothetical protein ACWDA7_14005 [Streptomyces sp. NPDC001156]
MSATGPTLCLCGCDSVIAEGSTFASGHDSTYLWRVLREDFGDGKGVSERFLNWYLENRPARGTSTSV